MHRLSTMLVPRALISAPALFAPLCLLTGILGWMLVAPGRLSAEEPPNFTAVGRPFLQKHCLDCHGADDPEAGLSLHLARDWQSVVKQRKAFERVLRVVERGEMPPEGQPRPSADEVAQFGMQLRTVFDYADRHAKPDPGRVTMRRLNRTEYRNTVRDLMGVDFDPTEDFPSDDIGHGFDNIGDVLSLSPVLMERYLAAAESVVSRAITPTPPPPTKRYVSTRYSEPASANVPMADRYRILSSDGATPVESGPINTPYRWVEDGEYIFRTKVYADNGGRPLKVAVMIFGAELEGPDGDAEAATIVGKVMQPFRIIKTFEVTATEPGKAQTLEAPIPPLAGRHRTMLGIVKPETEPAEGAPPSRLFVEYLALEGPLDTRPPSHRRLLAVSADKSPEEQTAEVVSRFLRRAYRRLPTEDEVARLSDFVSQRQADGDSWEAAMQLAMQAVLCSPKFLFRAELDDRPLSPEIRALDEFHLASRLSYFLWSTMPDDELLDLAERGELNAQLDAQVRRMLADPKSSALVENFVPQWLQIERLSSWSPDATLFPQFNEKLRGAMRRETELFFESVVREDRSVLELLDANYTYLNEPLARLYGIVDTKGNRAGQRPMVPGGQPIRGDQFQRVELQDRVRGGLLTQASVLTVTSNPTRTSPVKRGRWVLEQILGEPPPPPPPDVPELSEDEKAVAGGTLRERLEVHRQNPSCANCHAKMDPIGFALENFDAVGAFRTKDGEFPIDASGEFADGAKFAGPEDLKTILADKKDLFCRCLAEKTLTYALGRGLEYYDRPVVDRIVRALEAEDYRYSTLIREIVRSDPFRFRRGLAEAGADGE